MNEQAVSEHPPQDEPSAGATHADDIQGQYVHAKDHKEGQAQDPEMKMSTKLEGQVDPSGEAMHEKLSGVDEH
jgi:hypothetical protein